MDMMTSIEALVASGAATALVPVGPVPHGDSVRKRRPTWPRPDYLCLVYMTMDDGGLVARQVEGPIGANLAAAETELIGRAILGQGVRTRNFDEIVFKRPCYFTIVLDEAGWEFYYPDPGNDDPQFPHPRDPILFLSEKVYVDNNGSYTSRPNDRNKAFYELESVDIDVDEQSRKAIRCINFFTKNDAGDQVGHVEELHYSFNIFLRVPFSRTAVNKKITIIIDPDGQNQGPNP